MWAGGGGLITNILYLNLSYPKIKADLMVNLFIIQPPELIFVCINIA